MLANLDKMVLYTHYLLLNDDLPHSLAVTKKSMFVCVSEVSSVKLFLTC